MASNSKVEPPCKCGNKEATKFLSYQDDEEGLLGVFCCECGKEWLKEDQIKGSSSDDFIRFHDNILLLNIRPQATDERFFVQYNRNKIENPKYSFDMIKAGDHIQWERWLYDHHAIVEKVDTDNNTINVIEYKKIDKLTVEVTRSKLIPEQETIRNLYCICYDDGVTDSRTLVLARARAWLGRREYNLFTRNCETFSVYCQIGTLISWQTVCFVGKFMRCIKATFLKTCWQSGKEVTVAEAVEGFLAGHRLKDLVPQATKGEHLKGAIAHSTTSDPINTALAQLPMEQPLKNISKQATNGTSMRNLIGAGIIIVMEGMAVKFDVEQLYAQRKQGGISRKDFLHNSIQKIIEGLFMAGFVITGSVFGEIAGGAIGSFIAPGSGTGIGIIMGSIIGGVVMGVPGKLIGTMLGRNVGRIISATIKYDDKLVRFKDVKRGDQIVMYGWFLHPRCHAIVTTVDKTNRKIKVIRNTYEKGVIEQWLDFIPPVYRVCYDEHERNSAERAVQIAQSKIGENKYNILYYNCKHFAYLCVAKYL
ncbi:hypothetical protein HOLleu_22767 [Holothuria leucospilota]|uniref:LRAT domain-containing protein n=1 Tax=Holothuria leucospilota TaxID=206669 RepID=A0A9Q1BU63_HOLLE|nr:hypothetical protein HOLleu_22767 [Holothuria leucospilota]